MRYGLFLFFLAASTQLLLGQPVCDEEGGCQAWTVTQSIGNSTASITFPQNFNGYRVVTNPMASHTPWWKQYVAYYDDKHVTLSFKVIPLDKNFELCRYAAGPGQEPSKCMIAMDFVLWQQEGLKSVNENNPSRPGDSNHLKFSNGQKTVEYFLVPEGVYEIIYEGTDNNLKKAFIDSFQLTGSNE